jgi:hypothetical protein
MQAAGAALQAKQAHDQGVLQKAQLQYQSAAEQAALAERQRGRMRYLQQILGSQRAGLAASGIDPSSGSALAVQQAANAEISAQARADIDTFNREQIARDAALKGLRRQMSQLPINAALSFGGSAAGSYANYQALAK